MINQRIFSANVGDSSVGIAGPDAIETDIDNLLANDQELLGITGSKANLTTDDKTNLVAAINEHETQINDLAAYAVASGMNTYIATIPNYTLEEGQSVKIKFTNANTGASTLNINSLGAKSIQKSNGSALSSGNIKAGQICNLVYTGSVFQLLGEGGEYGTAVASDVRSTKTFGTESGVISGTLDLTNLLPENIKKGVNIGGIIGTLIIPISYNDAWTPRTSGFGASLIRGVAYGDSTWVIGGNDGKLSTSTDGITWTERTSGFGTTELRGVAYGSGMWVAVGRKGKLSTSTNGTSWTTRTSGFGTSDIFGVAYGDGIWVTVGNDGKLSTSTNGTSWTTRTSGFGTTTIYGVAYGNGIWVIGGNAGKLSTSTNGTSWTTRTSGFSTAIRGVAYGDGMWVAVGSSGKLSISTNGISWTTRTSGFGTSDIFGVAYGDSTWVIGGNDGKLSTSTNGITWTERTSSTSGYTIYSVAYGSDMWVAVGDGGKLSSLS